MKKTLLVDTNRAAYPIYQALLAAGHEVWVVGGKPTETLAKLAPNYVHLDYSRAEKLSAFIGQAAATEELSFAFIGDLSFFYDMNAIWNRHVGKNVRILLYNNEGGQTFHWNAAKEIDTLHLHTSAEHFTSAKGWVESRGFKYLSAHNIDEFDTALLTFMSADSEDPVLFEVFTKKESDARILLDYYEQCRIALENN